MALMVYKYRLLTSPQPQYMEMPVARQFLDVQSQSGEISLWYAIQAHGSFPLGSEVVKFSVVGTGCLIPPSTSNYLGTVQLDGYVWHIFTTHIAL